MLLALSAIASDQAAKRAETTKKMLKFLDHVITHPDTILTLDTQGKKQNRRPVLLVGPCEGPQRQRGSAKHSEYYEEYDVIYCQSRKRGAVFELKTDNSSKNYSDRNGQPSTSNTNPNGQHNYPWSCGQKSDVKSNNKKQT